MVLCNIEPDMIGRNDAPSRLLHYMKDRVLSKFKFKDIKLRVLCSFINVGVTRNRALDARLYYLVNYA